MMPSEHTPGLLEAAKAHIAARDALADANVISLKLDDPRFAAVTDTLDRLRATISRATEASRG